MNLSIRLPVLPENMVQFVFNEVLVFNYEVVSEAGAQAIQVKVQWLRLFLLARCRRGLLLRARRLEPQLDHVITESLTRWLTRANIIAVHFDRLRMLYLSPTWISLLRRVQLDGVFRLPHAELRYVSDDINAFAHLRVGLVDL